MRIEKRKKSLSSKFFLLLFTKSKHKTKINNIKMSSFQNKVTKTLTAEIPILKVLCKGIFQ